jgi:hypothetical protein
MHERPILVISSAARDLAFSAICEEKISRLWLEMGQLRHTLKTERWRGFGLRGSIDVRNTLLRNDGNRIATF